MTFWEWLSNSSKYSKYKRPEFIRKADMRQEMKGAAADLRKAGEQADQPTLQRVVLEVAEILEVVGSPPSPQEIFVWAIVYGLAIYGLLTLLVTH
jgi:hypothetical protein